MLFAGRIETTTFQEKFCNKSALLTGGFDTTLAC